MKGFTLVEALVAITILTVTISGSLYAANSALVAAAISRDQLTASYLAQEGVEYVRRVRDNGYLQAYQQNPATATSEGWNYFYSNTSNCFTPDFCSIDPLQGTISLCQSGTCQSLYLTSVTNGIYTQRQIGTETVFTRSIQVTVVAPQQENKVTSTVTWSYHGTPYSVTITDHLTSWQ